jgi:branched-chain amino acid transport system ATP-binding protein
MLKLQALHAGYGGTPVLQGVDLEVRPGEIVALLGRNGAGRSTVLKAVMGLVPGRGRVEWAGRNWVGQPAHVMAGAGLGYVPEGREVFPTLTVEQNLLLGLKPGRRRLPGDTQDLETLLAHFPRLRERWRTPAGVLSGGEQQMLTLCRTLMGQPKLLLVDEPTEGLAPQLVEQVASLLAGLRLRGVGVLMAEQKLSIAGTLADRCALMGRGRIVFEGSPAALQAAAALRQAWLEV